MEFFERAHVHKSKHSTRKESKSEENTKKKLKQILYGYHHSDHELIKESADLKNEFTDSSSVSGYSDLNLTNSSLDADKSQDIDSILDCNNTKNSKDNIAQALDDRSISSISIESISEYDEDNKSLSEDISPIKLDATYSEPSEDEMECSDFVVTSTDIDSNSNDELGSDLESQVKIVLPQQKKINKKKNNDKKKKMASGKSTARAKNKNSEYKGPYRPQGSTDNEMDTNDLSIDMSNISLPNTKEYNGPYRLKNENTGTKDMSKKSSVCSVDLFSPFVSVTATEMESQSLSDILGEYQYPTMRNLPSDSKHIFSADNIGLFETENASVVDIQTDEDISRQIEDDVGSLIPEIDNDIDDVDIDELELESSIQPVEESTEYDNTVETSAIESDTDSYNPTLNIPVNVYYGKNHTCVFVLKHPAEMYIHGKVKVQCLGGMVEILGYTLKDRTYEVYAPNYNYAQCVKTVKNQNGYYGLFGKLSAAGLSVAEAEDIVTSIGEFDVIISMQPLKSRQMEFVDNCFTVTDLFSKPSKTIDKYLKKASDMLGCSLYLTKPWKSFEENVSWNQAINCGMNKKSRGIISGGKGTGKSTFLRYYVNKLLVTGPVLVVDLDPGQCEFTIAGNVSATVLTEPLLGPNFTHLKTPELCLHLGMISPMDNPRRYANAVEALLTHCSSDERLRDLPWIVNTMGMTNTIGLKLMSLIILQSKPTFLLQLDSKNLKKRYDFHLYPQTIKNLYLEDYQNDYLFKNIRDFNLDYAFFLSHHTENTKSNQSLAARDERYLNFLAYFGQLLNMKNGNFLGIVPYEVNLKDISIGFNVKINEQSASKVVNGKVVALCERSLESGPVFTLAHTPLRCLGAGLVRGVDIERGVLYVVTPAGGALGDVGTLVCCDWAPELRGAAAEPGPGAALPYRTASHYHQRRFMFAPRRRFNPLQLIKISRAP